VLSYGADDDSIDAESPEHRDDEWDDSVDPRVGSKKWMAPTPGATGRAVDEDFAANAPHRRAQKQERIDHRLQRQARTAVADVCRACLVELRRRDPDATGRMSVLFEATAASGRARVHHPSIGTVVDLDDPDFERCVLERSARVRFDFAGEASVRVTYPFLPDVARAP
jgi:hypothetical protein